MGERVPEILRRALRLVEEQRPDAYFAMAAALDGLRVAVAVEGNLTLEGAGGWLVEAPVAGEERQAEIRLKAERGAIKALVAGEMTLVGALRGGEIELAGVTGALAKGLLAFEYFVGALLRIEGAEGLRRELER